MGWDGIYCGYGVATNQSHLYAGHDTQFTEGSKGQTLAKTQNGIAKPYMVTTSTYYPSNSVVFGPGLEKLRGKLLRKFNNSVVVCDNLCVRTSGRIMFVCTLDGYKLTFSLPL